MAAFAVVLQSAVKQQSDMDEKFATLKRVEVLNRRRDRTLGWILLAILVALMLVSDRLIYPLMTSAAPRGWRTTVLVVCLGLGGVTIAQVALLAIWAVLSADSLVRRLRFLVAGLVALVAAWVLGMVSTMENLERIQWLQIDELYACGLLPIALLAGSLPILGLRRFGARQIAGRDVQPIRQFVSIGGLMVFTAMVGFALAALQLPLQLERGGQIWPLIGILAAAAFGYGLFVILPTVWVLMSPKRSYLIWTPALIAAMAGLSVAVTLGIGVLLRPYRAPEIWPAVVMMTSAQAFISFGLGIARLFGYRLVTARKAGPN